MQTTRRETRRPGRRTPAPVRRQARRALLMAALLAAPLTGLPAAALAQSPSPDGAASDASAPDVVVRLPIETSGDAVATAIIAFRNGVWPSCPAAVSTTIDRLDAAEIVGPEALRLPDGAPLRSRCVSDGAGNCYCFGDPGPTEVGPILVILSPDAMDAVRSLWTGETVDLSRLPRLEVEKGPVLQGYQAGTLR